MAGVEQGRSRAQHVSVRELSACLVFGCTGTQLRLGYPGYIKLQFPPFSQSRHAVIGHLYFLLQAQSSSNLCIR